MLTETDCPSMQLLLPPGEKALSHDALPSGWEDRFPGGDCKGKGNFQILNIMLHPRSGRHLLNMQDFVQDLSGSGNFNFHGLILLPPPKMLYVYFFMAI